MLLPDWRHGLKENIICEDSAGKRKGKTSFQGDGTGFIPLLKKEPQNCSVKKVDLNEAHRTSMKRLLARAMRV